MAEPSQPFEDSVIRCADEIGAFLRDVAARHGGEAILGALAMHIAGAIRLYLKNGACTEEQARGVVRSIERNAFEETH